MNLLRYDWVLTSNGTKIFKRDSGRKITLSSCHEPPTHEYKAQMFCAVSETSCIVSFHISPSEGIKRLSFTIKCTEKNTVIDIAQEVVLKEELDFIIYFRLKQCFVKVYADGIVKHIASAKYQNSVHESTIVLQSLAHPFGSRKYFPHLSVTEQYQSV